MLIWQIATHEERCGFDWCLVKPGDPIQVLAGTRKRRIRCRAHAIGPVDEAAIERAYITAADEEFARAVAVAHAYECFFGRQHALPFDGKLAALGEDK